MEAFLEDIVDKQQTLQVPVSVARGLSCLRCNKVFSGMDSLERHIKIHAQRKEFQCTTCTKTFYRQDKNAQHKASCSRLEAMKEQQQNVPFERLKAENQTEGTLVAFKSTEVDKCQSALNGNLKTTLMKPRVNEKYDLNLFVQGKRGNVLKHLERAFKEKRGSLQTAASKIMIFELFERRRHNSRRL